MHPNRASANPDAVARTLSPRFLLVLTAALALGASAPAHAQRVIGGPTAWAETERGGIRGVTIGPIESSQQPGRGYGTPYSAALLDHLAEMGVNWVSLTPFGRIWSLSSTDIQMDFEAPYEDNRIAVRTMIHQARERGIRVLLIPHLWVETTGWRGEIDLLIGALRDPAPVADVVQQALFTDDLVLVARPGHPLVGPSRPELADLARHPWVLPREGTPSRAHFERFVAPVPPEGRPAVIESSSPILMRELLGMTDHIGCISRLQAGAEIALGVVVPLPVRLPGSMRPIGITLREDWLPTAAQDQFVAILHQVGQGLDQAAGPSATAT